MIFCYKYFGIFLFLFFCHYIKDTRSKDIFIQFNYTNQERG